MLDRVCVMLAMSNRIAVMLAMLDKKCDSDEVGYVVLRCW